MTTFPDLSGYGYRITGELGSNRSGGRVTYLATDLTHRTKVVIKEFQFAKTGSTWADFDGYKQEVDILRELNHPGIPKYLDSFQTPDGFCMVQEYKPARSLATVCSFNLEEIKQVAIATLTILTYLQHRVPPVIHRDIKPDNILIDDDRNVYLVDFGFARIGEGEVGVSSVVKGTLGFMPPEQLFNRQLTEASDLYGLGMTLICLLTGTKSSDVGNLVDITYKVNFKQVLPKVSPHWVHWLGKMVEPRVADRFPDAATALAALPVEKFYIPDATFSQASLSFTATHPRQKLTQTITIRNRVPDTVLEGRWTIAPHPSDPNPERSHPWITVEPAFFTANDVDCDITVDTSKLMSGKLFQRKLLLHSNTAVQTYPLTIQVQTAPGRLKTRRLPYGLILLLFGLTLTLGYVATWVLLGMGAETSSAVGFGAIAGLSIGLVIASGILEAMGFSLGTSPNVATGFLTGVTALFIAGSGSLSNMFHGGMAGAAVGATTGMMAGVMTGVTAELLNRRHINSLFATATAFLTTIFAIALGVGFTIGLLHSWLLLVLAGSGVPLAVILAYLPLRRIRSISEFHDSQRHLIKP